MLNQKTLGLMMTTTRMCYQSLEYIHFAFYILEKDTAHIPFIVLLIFEYLVALRKPTSAINVRIGNKEYISSHNKYPHRMKNK